LGGASSRTPTEPLQSKEIHMTIRRKLPWVSTLAGLSAALLLAWPLSGAESAPAGTVTILASAAVNGETSSCGCKKNDIGGIVKRATVIRTEGADGPTLLVDAGDFGADKDFDPWSKTTFIYDMMGEMGYDAVTPGETELIRGLDAVKELYARHPGVKVVSANIRDQAGNLIWDESAIIEKGGVKFGVTGVTGRAFYEFNLARGKQEVDEFTFGDPREALERVLPGLRQAADVVVVLMHESPADAQKTAEAISGMDVVVVGHNPGYLFAPERAGETLLLRPGNRGQYFSVLDLTLDENGRVVDSSGRTVPLGDGVAADPVFLPKVTAFEKDWTSRKEAQEAEDKTVSSESGD
jgi:2',3'-cyclic-nucleotide 2'-phosphodiesterase (5'-nucleotidase family)